MCIGNATLLALKTSAINVGGPGDGKCVVETHMVKTRSIKEHRVGLSCNAANCAF